MGTESQNSTAIVFDVGGVLLDWNPRYLYRKFFPDDPEAIERFLNEVGFFDWVRLQDQGQSVAETAAVLAQRFPAYRELIYAYDLRYEESLNGAIQPTVDLLHILKQAGYPVYCLSNWPVEKFRIVQPHFEFFKWFDAIVVSGEEKLAKPDPRIFEVLLARIGRTAGECLLIDDSLPNITTAKELGFQTIWFHSPEQLKSELTHKGLIG